LKIEQRTKNENGKGGSKTDLQIHKLPEKFQTGNFTQTLTQAKA